jgi:hypothetical protein
MDAAGIVNVTVVPPLESVVPPEVIDAEIPPTVTVSECDATNPDAEITAEIPVAPLVGLSPKTAGGAPLKDAPTTSHELEPPVHAKVVPWLEESLDIRYPAPHTPYPDVEPPNDVHPVPGEPPAVAATIAAHATKSSWVVDCASAANVNGDVPVA